MAQSTATTGADCWGQSFTYDRYANMTGISVTQCSAPTLSLGINTANNRVTTYSYDAAGNVTADGTCNYIWNAEGRMASAAGVNYSYDGYNRRVKKSNGKLCWYGLRGEVLAESDLSGNITSEYIYFEGNRIAKHDVANPNRVYYYLADRLGSSRVMVSINVDGTLNGCNTTTPTGCIVAESDFLPYGYEKAVVADSTTNTYKFTGHERDSETGLDHTLYRQYSSNTGRFLSPDVVRGMASRPQTWNRYAYVAGDPIDRIDPDGKFYLCVETNESEDCLDWEFGGYNEEELAAIALWEHWITNKSDQKNKRKKEIATSLAAMAALAKRTGDPRKIPAKIRKEKFCQGSPGEAYATYQILDRNNDQISGVFALGLVTITEDFPHQQALEGNFKLTPGKWAGSLVPGPYGGTLNDNNGTFVDFLSGLGTQGRALQEFSASGWFGNAALDIIWNGTSQDGVNDNLYQRSAVSVNGEFATQACSN